jgi:hypothetical protein
MRRFLVALALCAGASGAGAAAVCPAEAMTAPLHRASIEVFSPQTRFDLIRTVPRDELSKVAARTRPGDTDGLTEMQFMHKVEASFRSLDLGCDVPVVSIMLGASQALVYIAEEVPPDSCRFQAVYEHEMKHAKASQQVFDAAAQQLKKTVQQLVASPEFALQMNQSPAREDSLKELLETMAKSTIKDAIVNLNHENAKIDDEVEAVRMAARCAPAPRKREPQLIIGGSAR